MPENAPLDPEPAPEPETQPAEPEPAEAETEPVAEVEPGAEVGPADDAEPPAETEPAEEAGTAETSADDGDGTAGERPLGMRAWVVPVVIAVLFGVVWPVAGIVLLVAGILTAAHSNIVDASYNLAIGALVAVPSWFAARAAWTELRH